MRFQIYVALCMLGMFSFYSLCEYLVYSFSLDFAVGLGTGTAITIIFVFLAERTRAN